MNNRLIPFVLIFVLFQCKQSSNTKDQLEPSNDTSSYPTTSELLSEANNLYVSYNYVEATKLYTQILMIDSTIAEAFYKRGYCRAQQNIDDLSIKDYLKSAEMNYRAADAYKNIGITVAIIYLNDSIALHYFHKSYKLKPSEELLRMIKDLDPEYQSSEG